MTKRQNRRTNKEYKASRDKIIYAAYGFTQFTAKEVAEAAQEDFYYTRQVLSDKHKKGELIKVGHSSGYSKGEGGAYAIYEWAPDE